VSNEPDIEPPAKNSPPSDGVVATHSQCDLTQLSTKETLPGTITQIQGGERIQTQELIDSGREDTRKESDEMETGEEMTHDISCEGTPTHQHRETIKKRDYTHNIKHASIYQMSKDPPVKDEDPPLPLPQLSPKRMKKLKRTGTFPLRETDQEADIDTKFNTRRFPPTAQYTPTNITLTEMDYTFKVATLNITGISAPIKIHMLEEFLYKHDIDLALLQEVTNSKITTIQRYTSYINIGTEGGGTAILAQDSYLLTNTQRIPTGRGL